MSRGFRQRRWGAGAVTVGLALVTLWAGTLQPAAAESRDDIAEKQAEASNRVSTLSKEIDGIDAELSAIFVALEEANAKIPAAQAALDEANTKRDAADRAHEVALGQLDAAQSERDELDEELARARDKQKAANGAIGDLARRMYRSGSDSAVVLAFTKSGTQSIDERAQAAETLARSQSQALNAALDVTATQRTRANRLEAVAQRISTLEAAAKKALADAQAASAQAETELKNREKAKAEADQRQKEWNSRKDEAMAQLNQAQADYEAMTASLAQIDEENKKRNASYVSQAGFSAPLPAASMIVTSPFGYRMHPVLGYMKLHSGVDFGASCGTPVYATADGVVAAVSASESAGTYVDVNHGIVGGNSVVSEYLHLQATYVSVGQSVSAGTVLGEVGQTGYATGCHLHFGILRNGVNVDPMGYL